MKKNRKYIVAVLFSLLFFYNVSAKNNSSLFLQYSQQTLDSLYKYYGIAESNLLRETFPFDNNLKVTYLASEQNNIPNQYSYLWPYSGIFSSVNAIYELTGNEKYVSLLNSKILPGLEEYFDTTRQPFGYSSYVASSSQSDRFYDDNIWLGIDFTDLYQATQKAEYLSKAKIVWTFVMSGWDEKLGGGIYWCEQKRRSKHSCSNAPTAVLALKLFEATQDSTFFNKGIELYNWTRQNLRDSSDNLYYDNISLSGKVDKPKYSYNSGQMLQAAALLYKLTKKAEYLTEAKEIAKSSYQYFFYDFKNPKGDNFKMIKKGDVWFTAVMLRGFIELYRLDKNSEYLDAFSKGLNYAWKHARNDNGLFETDWSGNSVDEKKWVLTQSAMIEMYACMAQVVK